MTDLREKIVGCLRAWTEDTIEDIDAHGEVCCAESAEDLADRILALLPKMPELRWDAEDEPTDQAARAAVEAAVRKALGWVE